ncbi:hypothetical protein Goarm_019207, partial [Gossypium armourianum]|nr:hypothetical protein [Gossypium armourianum]
MSPHKFKDYSMVKMDIDVHLVVRHGVENIGIIARMLEDTHSREGDCQIASFDSSIPQIVCMNCRRNREDELKGIWKSWDEAKKTRFWDKYGDVAQLLFVKPDNALLKAMVRFWDPTYRCFTFNEVDMVSTIEEYSTLLHYDFRDLLRIYWKRNVNFRGPLANLMGLPVDTVKARLKDKNSPCISWSDIRDAMQKANGDRHLLLFTFFVYGLIVFPKALGYVSVELADFLFQIEKRAHPTSIVLAKTIISLNLIRRKGDERFLGYARLLFVWMKSHFRCLYKHFRQYTEIPRNRMEGSMDDSKHSTHRVQWSFVGSLNWHIGSNQLFLVDSSEPIRWRLKRSKISVLAQFKGNRKVLDNIAELTEKIRDLDIYLRRRDEEIQRLEADPNLHTNEKIAETEVLEEEICCLTKELKTKQAEDICEQIEELKKESTPFATRNEPAMKLL